MMSTLIEAIQNQFRVFTSHSTSRRRRRVNSVSPEQLESRHLLSAVVSLVEDLNVQPSGGRDHYRIQQAEVNGITFFTASTLANGNELWRTDGTTEGTFRLTDLSPGPPDSYIFEMTPVGDQLFFRARDSQHRHRLWHSDGTVSGTQIVQDSWDGYSQGTTAFGDVAFFANIDGTELWNSDGTESGTVPFVALPDQTFVTEISPVTENRFYFMTSNRRSGESAAKTLWVSDGSVAGTKELRTFNGPNTFPTQMTVVDGKLFFSISYVGNGEELWISDGSPVGTQLVKDVNPRHVAAYPVQLTVVGHHLFFTAGNHQDEYQDLWVTTGTQETTVQLTHNSERPVRGAIFDLSDFNGTLFYRHGNTIWTSDGTQQGTVLVADPVDMRLNDIVAFGPSMLLVGTDGEYGTEFRTFDEASSTVGLLKDVQPGSGSSLFLSGTPYHVGKQNQRFVFPANDGIHGYEIWTTDGTSSGTKLLVDLHPGTGDANPNSITSVNGELLFLTSPDRNFPGRSSLWSTDSTNHSVVPQGLATEIQRFEGNVYYKKTTPDGGRQAMYLWNALGGVPVAGSPPDIVTTSPSLRLSGGDYFFGTTSGILVGTVWQLRKSAGETSPSTLVREFYHVPETYLVHNDILYFIAVTADVSTDGTQSNFSTRLWRSDGTSEGTFALSETMVGAYSGPESQFLVVGDKIFLRHSSGLIVTDGTLLGTETVSGWIPDTGSVAALQLFEGKLLVSVTDTLGRSSLWKTDGTKAGTILVADRFHSNVTQSAVTSDTVLFLARSTDTSYNYALWRSDGTTTGTRIVHTFDDAEYDFTSLQIVGNKLFFTLENSETGTRAIWISDGTNEGTLPLRHDLIPDLVLDESTQFTAYDGGIGFRAATPEVGYELFRIDATILVAAPNALTVTNTAAQTQITWPDVVGAIQYDVWINSLNNPSAAPVKLRVNDPHYLVDSDLPEGAYRVWIRSLPVLGEPSAWSTAKDFTVGAYPALFSTPTATTDTRPTFQWAGPSDVVSYEIWLTNRDTKTRVLNRNGLTSTSFQIDQTLTPARYAVWVRGTRSDGTMTNWSTVNEFNVVRPAIEFTGGVGVQRTSRPTFRWPSMTGATGYNLQVVLAGTSTSVYEANDLKGLWHAPSMDLAGGNYTIRVQALKGTDPLSALGSGQTLRILIPPANLRSTETGFAWDAVPTAVSYTYELRNSLTQAVLYSKTQASTTLTPPTPLTPGQYTLRVYTRFVGSSSPWTSLAYEVFQPATVSITSSSAATADATPTINWRAVAGAVTYEVVVTRAGITVPVYDRLNIVGTSHRVDSILRPGTYQIQVRAIFANGSRTHLSAKQQLIIGPPPVVSFANGVLNWNSINAATQYELWVNYLGTPMQAKIVYQPNTLQTSHTLSGPLPKGRYQAWVRAVRAESGEMYKGLWSVALNFDIL